ncbi:MAG: copper resistance protein CopC, partial [Pseudolysinimonas sp.]
PRLAHPSSSGADSTNSNSAATVRSRSLGRGRTVLVTLLLALAGVLAVAAPAAAHAVLVSSDPVDGSRLSSSPEQVTLRFDEAVQLVPGTAKVLSATGDRADTAAPRLTSGSTTIVIPLKSELPRGSYTVTWRVISADTHVVVGSITFGVGQNAGSVSPTTTTTSALDVVADAAKGLGYLGAVLAFGLAAVGRTLWPWITRRRRTRTLGWIGGAALLAGTLLELLLQGPRATGSGWPGVLRLDDLGQTLGSAYGVALLTRGVLLAALVALRPWRATSSWRSWLPRLLLAVGVLATIAVSGHAAAGADAAIAIPVAVVHLAAMCVWLGGLIALVCTVLPRGKLAPRIHPRLFSGRFLSAWSLTAFVCVALLIVTGEYQAWREVQPVPSLWTTGYGITLLIKVGLVIVALGMAVAMRSLTAGLRHTGPSSFSTVRRSIWVETVVVAAVVVVTTVLVAQPPASTSYGPAAQLTAPLGANTIRIEVDTTRRGPEKITVTAVDAHGDPVALSSVDGVLSSESAGVAGLDVAFRPATGDSWRSVAAIAPVAGFWTLTLNTVAADGEAYATSARYDVW